jgi:hypothetical protein
VRSDRYWGVLAGTQVLPARLLVKDGVDHNDDPHKNPGGILVLMNDTGVGVRDAEIFKEPLSLCFKATIDDPTRFKRSRSVGRRCRIDDPTPCFRRGRLEGTCRNGQR